VVLDVYDFIGAEPGQMDPSYYKTAYRAAQKREHPDKNLGDDNANYRSQLVNTAFNEILKIPSRRKFHFVLSIFLLLSLLLSSSFFFLILQ
jgi:curved DNA-binding protein CbpA